MGTAIMEAENPAADYEERRRAEEATVTTTIPAGKGGDHDGRLQWRSRCRSNHLSDHLQIGGPLACRHEDGGWNVVFVGRYGLYGYTNCKTLAGPFEVLGEAKRVAAEIVLRANLRRMARKGS